METLSALKQWAIAALVLIPSWRGLQVMVDVGERNPRRWLASDADWRGALEGEAQNAVEMRRVGWRAARQPRWMRWGG